MAKYDQTGKVWIRNTFSCPLPNKALGEKRLQFLMKEFKPANKSSSIPCNLTEEQQKVLSAAYFEGPFKQEKFYFLAESNEIQEGTLSIYPLVLGYCGKLYYFLHVRHFGTRSHIYTDFIFNSVKELCKVFKRITPKTYWRKSLKTNIKIDEWSAPYKDGVLVEDMFFSLKTPLFALTEFEHDVQLVLNPKLKDLNLTNKFPPEKIYQDLDHYINNYLTNIEDAQLVRTDDLIRDSKGFDKWSFRQQGPKSRKN